VNQGACFSYTFAGAGRAREVMTESDRTSLLLGEGVEDLLAQRGVEVSYETVRRWCLNFGPGYATRVIVSTSSARVRTL
jgi:hypothetical protein